MSNEEPKLGNNGKQGLGIVFLTIFIDLVGFSIIFPLFPEMLEFYLGQEAAKATPGLLTQLVGMIPDRAAPGLGLDLRTVLFGGLLGSLYSLLQFVFSPVWGAHSDRVGRRPVLLKTVAATAIGYALWIFAGNLWLLFLSRIIAGVASGNISVATAAVADITTKENRSKGMAIIGIAFGLGFIIGPAIGGLTASVSKNWQSYGLNPFSFPALLSCGLALLNLLQINLRFKETLPNTKRDKEEKKEKYPIFHLFRIHNPAILQLCLLHLVFYITFSGMEFTLTFLAKERMGFGARQNGSMFILIGLTMVFVQGLFVRRLAKPVGEKNLVIAGILSAIAAFWLLAVAPSSASPIDNIWSAEFLRGHFLLGLLFMSMAIGLINPCITALVSIHACAENQGRDLGLLRSAGSLARVLGPIFASTTYFAATSGTAYKLGAFVLAIPLAIALLLKAPEKEPGS
jgi:MFS family permease